MRKIYLSLTGGLGNQLFQIAAALALARDSKIIIEWKNSRPRLNSRGLPEVTDFILPGNVTFLQRRKYRSLNSKSIGFLLRMGVNPRSYENSNYFLRAVSLLSSVINISTFGRYIPVSVNKGVGFFDHLIENRKGPIHLVGYFQTFKWSDDANTFKSLMNLRVQTPSPELVKLKLLSVLEQPLVVHMRFGDYRTEDSFGLLKQDYYRDSILELWKSSEYKCIWVFSDEISEAKKYLQGFNKFKIRFIPDVANSPSQTLEAMRLGKGYVIANSSFSWWAARLSYNQDAVVVAPTPWFIGQNEPVDLIPPNWERRMGHT